MSESLQKYILGNKKIKSDMIMKVLFHISILDMELSHAFFIIKDDFAVFGLSKKNELRIDDESSKKFPIVYE